MTATLEAQHQTALRNYRRKRANHKPSKAAFEVVRALTVRILKRDLRKGPQTSARQACLPF